MTEQDSPVKDRRIWVRILYMLFLWLAFNIAEFLLAITALFQAACAVFTGSTNEAMHRFGKNLSCYVQQIMEYITFNADELPFPFSDWPDQAPTPSAWTDRSEPEVNSAATGSAENDAIDAPDSAEDRAASHVEEATPGTDDEPEEAPPKPGA